MDRNSRRLSARKSPAPSPPTEAWLFAQAVLGNPLPNPHSAQIKARADRELLEFLAAISTRHEEELRAVQAKEAQARREREMLEWLAGISSRHEDELRRVLESEAAARESQARVARFIAESTATTSSAEQLFEWDPAQHPREKDGRFANKPGGVDTASRNRSTILDRNREIAKLSGVKTPSMEMSNSLARDIQRALDISDAAIHGAAAGLRTGGKAEINGAANAVINVVTLGLSSRQIELIGVTDEDRANGYDTAVAIATGSGQVLIAVGTGGAASLLSNGGLIAQTASGALNVFDAAGNAVGVVKGVYDVSKDGPNLGNVTQATAGALGLKANLGAAKSVGAASKSTAAADSAFRVGKHGEMPTPRQGQHSHHGVMSAWMERHFAKYDPDKAPAILMPDANHIDTYAVFNHWRIEITRKMNGTFDWQEITEADVHGLSEKMFDAAKVPDNIRQEYWKAYEKMKAALTK